jgi:hypothetical protein
MTNQPTFREEASPWTFDPDSRNIEFNSAPVFRVYEADDFPCIEDEDRAEAADWYDAQAQTVVLVLNSMLHDNGDDAPIPGLPTAADRLAAPTDADDWTLARYDTHGEV